MIWLNLLLRLLLAAFALKTKHWSSGDTAYFLDDAQKICAGAWGGSHVRCPLYSQFLCVLGLPGAMFAQTIIIWFAGVILLKKTRKEIGTFFLWDPVYLAYSSLFMADALFGVSLFFVALCLDRILKTTSSRVPARDVTLLGFAIGVSVLIKPLGLPLGAYCFLVLAYSVYQGRLSFKKILISLAVLSCLLAPRLYWTKSQIGRATLSTQSEGWIDTVAAYIEYYGTGLDPVESELKYRDLHQGRDHIFPYKVIASHLPLWAFLTSKGAMRVLFGHVNVEWTYLATGFSPIGPGWFKVPEHREGMVVSGLWILPWTIGLIFTAIFCLYVYWKTFKATLRAGRLDAFSIWLIGSIFLLVFIPQVWGDDRFRMPLWPLVLLLWDWSERRAASQSLLHFKSDTKY